MKFDLVKTIAKAQVSYHANMLDVYRVLNMLKILNDEKTESKMKDHTMAALEALRIQKGYNSIEEMMNANP